MITSKKSSILYIGGFELPDKNAAAHRVLNNAKIFRESGMDTVFIGVDKQLNRDSELFQTKSMVQGFESYAVPYPKRKKDWLRYLTDGKKYIDYLKKNPNVSAVVFYNFQALAMQSIVQYCRKHNINCYADVTEWYSAKGKGLVYFVLKGLDTEYRMRYIHKKMNGLIVISRFLEGFYRTTSNVVCIPALTDLTEEKWKNDNRKSEDTLFLAYAGSPELKDKLDMLVEAVCRTTRMCHLDVIGITKEQYLDLHPDHKDMVSCDKILFHGRLPHPEALEYIKKANYSCFFRENNRVSKAGFPTKLAEAVSAGTPVLTNSTSDISEYVTDTRNGILVPELSVEAILQTIECVPNQVEVDRQTFDYKKYIDKMAELWE